MFKFGRKERLIATIVISLCFFSAEIAAGFYTRSLALVADAFHYLSDLIGFVVALTAVLISERPNPAPKGYTFGYQRATLLGAFFNGVFLLALGVSILVQAIERFTKPAPVENPKIVLIIGSIGLGLNLLVMSFLHEHDHGDGHGHSHGHSHSHSHDQVHDLEQVSSSESSTVIEEREYPQGHGHYAHKHKSAKNAHGGRDLGMLGVLIHVIGDAINNVGVIVSALVIWKTDGDNRYYIDPAIGVFIAIMIFVTAIPLTKHSGGILLEIAPGDINVDDVKHDIEMIPGVESVHELHIWRLNQRKSVASAHVSVKEESVSSFSQKAKVIMECLHAYGVHSATLQPEVVPSHPVTKERVQVSTTEMRHEETQTPQCQLICGSLCHGMRCCPPVHLS